ncbi:MAG: hypothetical protein IKR86_06400 [Candidatus Methanomethylophilaceae archaeon]|nr:hypothetical protein [Candidatus Methanomethylophilaceae archaeon]
MTPGMDAGPILHALSDEWRTVESIRSELFGPEGDSDRRRLQCAMVRRRLERLESLGMAERGYARRIRKTIVWRRIG